MAHCLALFSLLNSSSRREYFAFFCRYMVASVSNASTLASTASISRPIQRPWSGKKRLLFMGRMLRRGLAQIAKGRLESRALLIRERPFPTELNQYG